MRLPYITPVFVVAILTTIALSILVYTPGLKGDFAFDDFPNILQNKSIRIDNLTFSELKQAALSGRSGPLKRPVSMLSFALNYHISGFNPFYFKLSNVIIHAINGIGIFMLAYIALYAYRKNTKPDLSVKHIQWLALLISAAWLVHPANLTPALYVVQRMTSLSTLFTIIGLILYIHGRLKLIDGNHGIHIILISTLVLLPLSVYSKENGVLLPVYMLMVEYTLFSNASTTKPVRLFLRLYFSILVLLPVITFLTFFILQPGWLYSVYNIRDFNLTERLMTEARVIWFYFQISLLPDPIQLGLHHDDFGISRSLLQPVTTLLAILGIIALILLAIFTRKKTPLISFGVLFFLAGHSMESTIIPLELVHEHRNYLPIFGLLFIIFYYLTYPFSYIKTLRLRQIFALVIIIVFGTITTMRASYWGNLYEYSQVNVRHHPNSSRANHQAGRIYTALIQKDPSNSKQYYVYARNYFEKAASLNKSSTIGLFGLIILAETNNKKVDPKWLNKLNNRLKNSPYAAVNASALRNLAKCQEDKICHLNDKTMVNLFYSSLQNPTIRAIDKAAVLATASGYFANVMHNHLEAVKLATQAALTLPNELQYRINLVDIFIAIRDYESARKQIIFAKKMDKHNIFAVEIKSYEKKIPVK